MQILLSRIEREYIINSFKKKQPDLRILVKGIFYRVGSSNYKIKDNHVFFKEKSVTPKNFIIQKNTKIFFTYKDISFNFFTNLKKENHILFFKISDKIYKTKSENDDKFYFLLETSTGFKMKAHPINNFPLAYCEKNTNTLKKTSRILTLTKELTDLRNSIEKKLSSALIQRINEIYEYTEEIKINTSILFIDSNFILIFCTERQANIIATSISTKIEILLKNRKIKASVSSDFFYSIANKNILFFTDREKQMQSILSGILCLNIKKIQEEDKRFLHEYVYADKYGFSKL